MKPENIVKEKIENIKDVTAPIDNIPIVSPKKIKERKLAIHVILAGIICTAIILTILAKQYPYFQIDLAITRLIQNFNPDWFDLLMKFVTQLGNPTPGLFITLSLIAFIIFKKRNSDALMLAISIIGANIISLTLKVLISRPRPTPDLINQTTKFLYQDSFPSGHVMFYIGCFGFLFYLVYILPPKSHFRLTLLIILGVLICLIGPSRIYVGAHWFSDVMGAYLIGFLWLFGVITIYNKVIKKYGYHLRSR